MSSLDCKLGQHEVEKWYAETDRNDFTDTRRTFLCLILIPHVYNFSPLITLHVHVPCQQNADRDEDLCSWWDICQWLYLSQAAGTWSRGTGCQMPVA